MPSKPRVKYIRTVRRDVVSHRTEERKGVEVVIADVLSCGHEFSVRVTREKGKSDRLCRICTAEMLARRGKV